ncbi:MAG TPA: hypothetical protein VF756_28405 [Thermoanaerobaculia bacterium]
MSRRKDRLDGGYALLAAVFTIFLLSIALAILASSLHLHMRLVREEERNLRLRALSDAALAETLYNLRYDSYFDGVEERPFGGGAIRSYVTFVAPGRFHVLATATYARRQRTVEAEVFRTPTEISVVRWRRVAGS